MREEEGDFSNQNPKRPTTSTTAAAAGTTWLMADLKED